jgi:hypothetical protein
MPQYMLLIYNDVEADAARRQTAAGEEGGVSAEQMAAEGKRWGALVQTIKDAGALVDNRGLQGVEASTTVRVRDGETHITDGPFAETKELLAGYIVVDVPDLDTALGYASQIPSAETGSIEVRPVWG